MTAVLLLALMGGILWFLYRLKARDVANCAAVLGLAVVKPETTKGTTPEGLAFVQRRLLRGSLLGHQATLSERTVRHPRAPRPSRGSSQFTVLELTLPASTMASIRLQPEGMLGVVEQVVRGGAGDRVAIEPSFDAAYTTYSDDPPRAREVLTPALRAQLLAFRASVADLPTSVAGRMASALMLGTLHVEGSAARYVLWGSPTTKTAEQAKAAAPVLLELAAAAQQR